MPFIKDSNFLLERWTSTACINRWFDTNSSFRSLYIVVKLLNPFKSRVSGARGAVRGQHPLRFGQPCLPRSVWHLEYLWCKKQSLIIIVFSSLHRRSLCDTMSLLFLISISTFPCSIYFSSFWNSLHYVIIENALLPELKLKVVYLAWLYCEMIW